MNNLFYRKPKTQTLSNLEVQSFLTIDWNKKPEKPLEYIIFAIIWQIWHKRSKIIDKNEIKPGSTVEQTFFSDSQQLFTLNARLRIST